MKCMNCNHEIAGDDAFCENCGTPVPAEVPAQDITPDPIPETPETVVLPEINEPVPEPKADEEAAVTFCPNCGKQTVSGELFCDECGASLNTEADTPAVQPANAAGKKGFNKKLLMIPLGIAVLGLGAFAVSSLMSGGSGGSSDYKVPKKIVYFKDDTMMLREADKKKAQPVEITDSLWDDNSYRSESEYYDSMYYRGTMITKDGSCLYYMEDYDGSYNLYRAQVSKPEDGEKVDSNVTRHQMLQNNGVVYLKNETLYYYSGKKNADKVKFAKNVYSFGVDKEQKYIYWTENDKNKTVYYLQDLEQKKDSVELIKGGIDDFYATDDFTTFYALDNNRLYKIDRSGNSEKVSSNVETIISFGGETGDLYYAKNDGEELHYLDKNGDVELTDSLGNMVGSNQGAYCVYTEDGDFKLAIAGVVIDCDDLESVSRTTYHADSKQLYIWDDEEECLYKTALTGKNAGTLEEVDGDTADLRVMVATDDGIYYIKDVRNNTGDLYFNGTEVASDAYNILYKKDGKVVTYMADYDRNDGTFEVRYLDGKKDVLVAEDVYRYEIAKDGTMILLADFSSNRGEGELVYFNGKELQPIDDEVNGFAPRYGSTRSFN